MTTAPPPQENAGLTSLVETIVAPTSAFDRLAEKQTWGWAFIASSILTIVAALASGPVQRHIARLMTEQSIAATSTAQQAAAKTGAAIGMKISEVAWVFSPLGILFMVLIATVILLICNAVLGGKASFKQLWCATMNVSIVFAIGSLVGSILLAVRGPDAFTGVMDIYRNSLSLAAIIPSANIKLIAFLAAFTPFTLWQLWLNSLLMQRIARLAAPRAWAAALVVFLIPALIGAAFARLPPAASGGTPPTTSTSASP
ncbi:MAG: YIP1 family protein [Candidatus Baltobacteraceae bacterium]